MKKVIVDYEEYHEIKEELDTLKDHFDKNRICVHWEGYSSEFLPETELIQKVK